jgi:acyl-CoA dehydrogenase
MARVCEGEEAKAWSERAALITPIAKAFSTDIGLEVASLGVQVHGGMGFIEETGAARLLRDARIAPIYEGTNGIQAIDLVMRKLPLSGGLDDLEEATDWMLAAQADGRVEEALSGATPYLRLAGLAYGGALLAKGRSSPAWKTGLFGPSAPSWREVTQ